ncbi:MAG: hypothetical protein ACKOYJ_02925, partial [Planctomycetia bacterium]
MQRLPDNKNALWSGQRAGLFLCVALRENGRLHTLQMILTHQKMIFGNSKKGTLWCRAIAAAATLGAIAAGDARGDRPTVVATTTVV